MFCLLILWGLIPCSWASGATGNVWMTSLSLTITFICSTFLTPGWLHRTCKWTNPLRGNHLNVLFFGMLASQATCWILILSSTTPWRFWIYCQYTYPSETTISLTPPSWESANASGGIMRYLNWLSFPLGFKTLKKWQPSFISFSSQYLNNFSQLFLLVCMAWLIHSLGLGK